MKLQAISTFGPAPRCDKSNVLAVNVLTAVAGRLEVEPCTAAGGSGTERTCTALAVQGGSPASARVQHACIKLEAGDSLLMLSRNGMLVGCESNSESMQSRSSHALSS